MDFHDKVAVITGAASGIGRACALALARDGARVAIADRDANATHMVVEGIKSWGGQAIGIIANVSQESDAARIAAETVSAWDGIDILVNNAAVQARGTVESTPLDRWNETIAINLTSVYLVSRFIVPEMRRRGGGSIINIAAIQGLVTEPNLSAYTASKGGVLALTRTMALDYASEGIRVNSICPGVINTPLLRESLRLSGHANPDEHLPALARAQPIGRLGSPEEVAELVLFLASSHASFITGSTYTVDGGAAARY